MVCFFFFACQHFFFSSSAQFSPIPSLKYFLLCDRATARAWPGSGAFRTSPSVTQPSRLCWLGSRRLNTSLIYFDWKRHSARQCPFTILARMPMACRQPGAQSQWMALLYTSSKHWIGTSSSCPDDCMCSAKGELQRTSPSSVVLMKRDSPLCCRPSSFAGRTFVFRL